MSPRAQRRPGELAFAVALLAFSLWLFSEAYKISGFSGLSTPGVFPMLASGLMAASSLAILVKVLAMGPAGGGLRRFLADITPLRQTVMVALVFAYIAAMPHLGFLAASGLFLFVSIQFLWRRNVVLTALVSLAGLAAIHVVFTLVFQVVLPKGTLLRGLI
ncbi:tripartite tricarboxylate transporter TctB family protein [Stappia sp. TSB10GB4]|uniref:tripartite tricarboxylate transporter TctB family protein n=1 Tax=Stappia sp. TSB10GB4 TaxID=2003584 RepID=UPI001648860E|nr:tripartite tricarboxylate transporter TctB family protein [Stappia sp. TSB10GB4]